MRSRRRPRRPAALGPPRSAAAVGRFVLGSVAAVAVVAVGGYLALRSVALRRAERTTRQLVEVQGRLISSTGLSDGLLRRDPDSLAKLDDAVVSQVLFPSAVRSAPSIVRVKLWAADGTILYSDVPELIGRRFSLGADERRLLRSGGAEAQLSDLDKPENASERQFGRLLEAYTAIRTPNGTPVLFETYQPFSSVEASASSLLGSLAPPLVAGLAVLLLSQVPLAWSMARRLQAGHREREALLAEAIDASDRERRRIASDLHDGVVQDVAGVAFGLAPLAEAADRGGEAADAEALRSAMATLRQSVRDLRTLLVEIHPPSLESAGLEAALADLLSPLQAGGLRTELEFDPQARASAACEALAYRVAREALRNVRAHAAASSVRVAVTRPASGRLALRVSDDGRGFDPAQRERSGEQGHLGLALLDGLARQAGGTLLVRSAPGAGTTVELEVPAG